MDRQLMSGAEPVKLDRSSLSNCNFLNLIDKGNFSPYYWHKIEVTDGNKFKAVNVLDSVIHHCLPEPLFPVKYVKSESSSSFLVSQCKGAIIKLCESDLSIQVSESNVTSIIIHLNFSTQTDVNISFEETVKSVCNGSRVNKLEKTIDLSYFPLDPGLKNIFCPLWSPFSMKTVLCTVRSFTKLRVINLSHNKLTTLEHLGPLIQLAKLGTLVLSHNLLDWEGFKMCPSFRLREIFLDQNPLCQNISPYEYIKRIREVLPTIKRIDNEEVHQSATPEFDFIGRNCLIDKNCQGLVDQFVYHYMTLFQGSERAFLINMYHPQAAISVSTCYLPNESTSDDTELSEMKDISRNILKISDYWKAAESFSQGQKKVVFILSLLPPVSVDRTTLTVDVPLFKENEIIIIEIMGVFRTLNNKDYCMNFTFVLNPVGGGEWQISNHLIAITNATTLQVEKAFLPMEDTNEIMENPLTLTKSEMIKEFQELTKLKEPECCKFLEESVWNLEDALQTFLDLYKGGLIPVESFAS